MCRQRPGSTARTPFVLHGADTFGTALSQLTESGLHHLYIVDESRRPVGVLSLSDVLEAVSAYLSVE